MGLTITIRNRLHLLFRDFALLGTKETLRYYAARLERRLREPDSAPIPLPAKLNSAIDENFDQRFGVDTNQIVHPG